MSNGWDESAGAWIASLGERGDFGRAHVLDRPMLAHATQRPVARALDVGCGEGRFCRMLKAAGVAAIGIDPTEPLLSRARALDPEGDYRLACAEALPFADASFDLVVSYLSLIDIPDYRAGIAEMDRVLAPGGALLIANLNGFASSTSGWIYGPGGEPLHYPVDRYLEERGEWAEWRGIRIVNWHRPLSAYMSELLGRGLQLAAFEEPASHSGDPARRARYDRAPWFVLMEWRKPA